MKKYLFIILGLALAFVSCKKDSENPQPIDTWVGNYDGVVGMKGTVESPITMDTLFDKSIDMSLNVMKLLSGEKGIFTFKYGVLPIPFNASVTETTASLDDLEFVPTIDIPIMISGMAFNINGIKFSKIVLNYDNGVVTGSGNALITAMTTTILGEVKVYLNLKLTPNFTKKQE